MDIGVRVISQQTIETLARRLDRVEWENCRRKLTEATVVTWLCLSMLLVSPALADQTQISWSERPGCFERHLQRRYNNPLFRLERRHVTATEVARARQRDAQDFASLRAEYVQFLSEIAQVPDYVSSKEINTIRERIHNLTRRAAQVGGQTSEIASNLTILRGILIRQWSKALNDDPNALKALQEAEAFYQMKVEEKFHNPFVAQLNRKDTCIPTDEMIPALLTEDVATIQTVKEILGEHVQAILYEGAVALVRKIRARGEMLPGIDKKLATLGTTSN